MDDYGALLATLKGTLRQIERMTDGLDHSRPLPRPVQAKLDQLRAREEQIGAQIDRYHDRQEREAREWMADQATSTHR